MFDEKELRTAADTLMSMCTSFLTGKLKEEVFRSNLLLFAEQANSPKSKTIDRPDSAELADAKKAIIEVLDLIWNNRNQDNEGILHDRLGLIAKAVNSLPCEKNNR